MLKFAVYLRRECVLNQSMRTNQSMRESVYEDKIFDKINCNVVNLEDCHYLKGDCVIVKFSKKKDCKQVLSVKN